MIVFHLFLDAGILDSIADLLKKLGLSSYIIILLAIIIQFTDIPQRVVNWFRYLFRPISDPDWTEKPYRRPLLPIIGWLTYKRNKKKLGATIDEFIKERANYSVLKRLLSKDNVNYESSYELFDSRNNDVISDEELVLVSGLPGTGKSTFVSKTIELLHVVNKLDFLIHLNRGDLQSKFKQLLKPLVEKDTNAIWTLINDRAKVGEVTISPSVASYILNYKRVYFVIEDIHDKEEIEALFENFNKYKKKSHKKNKRNINLIITTRNVHLIDSDFEDKCKIIKLDLLTTDDCEKLFYKQCQSLGLTESMNFHTVVTMPQSPTKFTDPLTKNPLVVDVLTSLLYFNREKDIAIQRISNSIVGIFQSLTDTLYNRSGANSDNQALFDILYQDLAFKIRGLEIIYFDGNLVPSTIVEHQIFNLSYLSTHGFIGDKGKSPQRYFFLHQTIMDILFINHMIRNNDYTKLNLIRTVGEEYIYYLREQLQSFQQYSVLIKDDLRIGSKVMNQEFFSKIKGNTDSEPLIYQLIDNAISVYLDARDQQSKLDDLVCLVRKIDDFFKSLPGTLLASINAKPVSIPLIKMLLHFGHEKYNQYVLSLSYKQGNRHVFTLLIDEGNIALNSLYEGAILNPITSPLERTAIFNIYIGTSKVENKRSAIVKLVLENYSAELFDILFKIEENRKYILKEYSNINVKTSQRVSYHFRDYYNGGILIPRGVYSVEDSDVSISRTIIVSKDPLIFTITGKDIREAAENAKEHFSDSLWTYNHFQVAYKYFNSKHGLNSHGILGIKGNLLLQDVKYEAYKDDNSSNIGFGYFQNIGSNNALEIHRAENSNLWFTNRVIFRRVLASS